MKIPFTVFTTLFLFVNLVSAANPKVDFVPPQLELELSAFDYQTINSQRGPKDTGNLKPVMDMGKRFLDWLIFINAHRPEAQKISLSGPGTQPGYPIDKPNFSNRDLILKGYESFKGQMPEWLSAIVLTGGAAFTENPPVSDTEFISWGLKLNALYEKASRWLLQEPYLWGYAMKKSLDVRGYYFLGQIENLESKLSDWNQLPELERTQLEAWLVGMCYNSASTESACRSELTGLFSEPKKIFEFYKSYLDGARTVWNEFFQIRNARSDIDWNSSHLHSMNMPFLTPDKPEVSDFLTRNIEEEWKWNQWALKLNFIPSGSGTVNIEFIPGATPHVNSVGGNIITMDANQPLTEYHVQWTIRHEFGHTLGFPDCYVEFYDTKERTMVSYQLDLSNIMCSRRGHLKETHYDELKKWYLKD